MSLNEAEEIHVAKKAKLETLTPTEELKDHSAEEVAPQSPLIHATEIIARCGRETLRHFLDAVILPQLREPDPDIAGSGNWRRRNRIWARVRALWGCASAACVTDRTVCGSVATGALEAFFFACETRRFSF